MKHQIALVGGQLLPIYVGIKEFSPDKIHFIVSKVHIFYDFPHEKYSLYIPI